MPGSRPSSTPLKKSWERKAGWIALEEPVEFTAGERTWVVQDYNPLLDMFLCEGRRGGQFAVWLVRFDQIAEYISDIPGIRTRSLG